MFHRSTLWPSGPSFDARLLRQRIFGIAFGHEDLIDHDTLRDDPALAAVLDKPGGSLAGKSTLNRMEHAGKIGQDRHHKLDHDGSAIERLFVDLFLDAHAEPPTRIVGQIRARWPKTTIVIRAGSGFCRDDLMLWCETNDVRYVLGLAGNSRSSAGSRPLCAGRTSGRSGWGSRRACSTISNTARARAWSATRRVIAKAEWTNGQANPRFIVTNVHAAFGPERMFDRLAATTHRLRVDVEPLLNRFEDVLVLPS